MGKGKLIVFEGIDDVGKTTLAKFLTSELLSKGIPSKTLSFPGKIKNTLGNLIYELHHNPIKYSIENIDKTSLQLLHVASHIDAINKYILPEYKKGTYIILDRFWWSTVAYGRSEGISASIISRIVDLEKIFWRTIKPDIIFYISRKTAFLNSKPLNFTKLNNAYKTIINTEKKENNVYIFENNLTIKDATNKLYSIIKNKL